MELSETPYARTGHDPTEVPPWSGFFIRLGDGPRSSVGVLLQWLGDPVGHRPPPGWHFAKDEPDYCMSLDAEVWLCRTT